MLTVSQRLGRWSGEAVDSRHVRKSTWKHSKIKRNLCGSLDADNGRQARSHHGAHGRLQAYHSHQRVGKLAD
jgi:hypothetical protein